MKQNRSSQKEKIIYFVVLLLSFLWCVLIVLAPVLKSKSAGYDIFLYFGFSRVCHQIPERSFFIFGEKFAVCERCTAIYFSFFAGVLLYPLTRRLNKPILKTLLLTAIFLIVIDFLFGYIGMFQNIYTRVISGAVFGFCSAYFVTYGIIDSITGTFKSSGGFKIGK